MGNRPTLKIHVFSIRNDRPTQGECQKKIFQKENKKFSNKNKNCCILINKHNKDIKWKYMSLKKKKKIKKSRKIILFSENFYL